MILRDAALILCGALLCSCNGSTDTVIEEDGSLVDEDGSLVDEDGSPDAPGADATFDILQEPARDVVQEPAREAGPESEPPESGVDEVGTDSGNEASTDAIIEFDASDHPVDIPSKQTITFRAANKTAEVRYLLQGGSDCSAFGMEQFTGNGWRTLPLLRMVQSPNDECCMSAGWDGPSARYYLPLQPNESGDLVWDGRADVMTTDTFFCGGGHAQVFWSALQPVPPGKYRVTVGVESQLPDSCGVYQPPLIFCEVGQVWAFCQTTAGPTCEASIPVSVEFELPADGDIVIAVDVT